MKVTSADIHLKDQIFDVNTSKELSATSTGSKASLQVAAKLDSELYKASQRVFADTEPQG